MLPIDKEEAKQKIEKLVAKLQDLGPSERDAYKKKEENTKKDLILPLFRALGWDTEDAREVFAEYDASNGAVDYAFRVRGVARFFVEAKPLEANLTDAKSIKQAIGYALHRGIPWAILTSFDSLHMFYALGEAPKPEMLRWKTLRYTDYIEHFEDLWLLSRESIESGATAEAAQRDGRLPPRLTIEQRLFRQFREWRETLTNDLLRYHEGELTDAQVDEVIERLFNRLIFIRNCEDRQIEDRLLWQAWREWVDKNGEGRLVASLRRIFSQFHDWYDSDLFPDEPHLLDRPDRVHLDDSPLEDVVRGLYVIPGAYADYDFKRIDADVLGAVYEQYLGHVAQVARERAGQRERTLQLGFAQMGRSRVEFVEKRAKRKQQGIYYTPKWVTDYIVREAVGKTLDEAGQGKGAAEERLFSIRILDPACGSGSFLIRAYDEILRRAALLSGRPEDHVFADERGAILKQSIYGVDLDPQAVDIARLNLMLRGLARREKLPELRGNVQTGNSLISGGEKELRPYFGDAWEARHPFNWQERFRKVMAEGGFDVVVGNPPYVETALIPEDERNYYRDFFEGAYGLFDLYVLFLERGMSLLKEGGRLGYITSAKFLKAEYGKKLLGLIDAKFSLEQVIDLSAQKAVFGKEAMNYPAIFIIRNSHPRGRFLFCGVPEKPAIDTTVALDEAISKLGYESKEGLGKGIWPPQRRAGTRLMAKLESGAAGLGKMAEIYHGLQTNADPVFIVQFRKEAERGLTRVFSKATRAEHDLESALLHPLLKGSVHIRRYMIDNTNLLLLLPYYPASGNLLPRDVMEQDYPCIWRYLNLPGAKSLLEGRDNGRWRGQPNWYGYTRLVNHDKFGTGRPRLVTPSIASRSSFTYDREGSFYFVGSGGGGGGGYGIELKAGVDESLLYLLGLLNSTALAYYLHQISSFFKGGYWAYNRQYISRLPIRRIGQSNGAEVEMRDRIIHLVERMLEVKKRIAAKGNAQDSEREDLDREAEHTDRQIDLTVYDLYGLTESERRLVEAETQK